MKPIYETIISSYFTAFIKSTQALIIIPTQDKIELKLLLRL